MPSLGIIVLNIHQENAYYREIGKCAARKGITLYRFIPSNIDPYTEKITGEVFNPEHSHWEAATFPIPDILYDRCFYTSKLAFKTHHSIVQWLKNRCTFLGFGLPGKWHVYEALNSDPQLQYYTIDTEKIRHPKQITHQLNARKPLLLKPESGSQGNGIFFLKKSAKDVTVNTERSRKIVQKKFASLHDLHLWLKSLLKQATFLMQPFLSLQDDQQRPFDIRIFLQKDDSGDWVERGRGIRKANKGQLVSNLHRGGDISNYNDWLTSLPKSQRTYIEEELEMVMNRVPPLLEKSFGRLFELGLDIGIDQNGAIWILEVNSKPGHQVALQTLQNREKLIYDAPVYYSEYLRKQKELTAHETTAHSPKNE